VVERVSALVGDLALKLQQGLRQSVVAVSVDEASEFICRRCGSLMASVWLDVISVHRWVASLQHVGISLQEFSGTREQMFFMLTKLALTQVGADEPQRAASASEAASFIVEFQRLAWHLKSISMLPSPLQKLERIAECYRQTFATMKRFLQRSGQDTDSLGADELIPFEAFVTYISGLDDLFTEIGFLRDFVLDHGALCQAMCRADETRLGADFEASILILTDPHFSEGPSPIASMLDAKFDLGTKIVHSILASDWEALRFYFQECAFPVDCALQLPTQPGAAEGPAYDRWAIRPWVERPLALALAHGNLRVFVFLLRTLSSSAPSRCTSAHARLRRAVEIALPFARDSQCRTNAAYIWFCFQLMAGQAAFVDHMTLVIKHIVSPFERGFVLQMLASNFVLSARQMRLMGLLRMVATVCESSSAWLGHMERSFAVFVETVPGTEAAGEFSFADVLWNRDHDSPNSYLIESLEAVRPEVTEYVLFTCRYIRELRESDSALELLFRAVEAGLTMEPIEEILRSILQRPTDLLDGLFGLVQSAGLTTDHLPTGTDGHQEALQLKEALAICQAHRWSADYLDGKLDRTRRLSGMWLAMSLAIEPGDYEVLIDGIRMRMAPEAEAPILAGIPKGARIRVTEVRRCEPLQIKWLRLDGAGGWICHSDIDRADCQPLRLVGRAAYAVTMSGDMFFQAMRPT
jgi:hypothetical protein